MGFWTRRRAKDEVINKMMILRQQVEQAVDMLNLKAAASMRASEGLATEAERSTQVIREAEDAREDNRSSG